MDDAKLVQDRALQTVPCGASQDVGEGLKTIVISPPGKVESLKGLYIMDREAASTVVAEFDRQGNDVPIDWEHESLEKSRAPAAGWITRLWFDERRGLMGLVQWNTEARSAIRSGHWKYLSPVLIVRRDDRRAVGLESAAITNKPAIPHMEKLAASQRNSNTNREIQVMTEHATTTVETERILGELRSLLVTMGDELPEEATREMILRAAIEKLKELKGDESAEGEGEGGSADDAEIASSVRRKLGLPAEASKDQVCLALSVIDLAGWQKQLKAKDAELVALRKEHVGREVFEFLTPYAMKGVIERDSKCELKRKDYAEILELAGFNRSLCKQVLDMRVANMPPQGRTTRDANGNTFSTLPPTGGEAKRAKTIAASCREIEDNPELQRLTNKQDHTNQALREAGLPKLSDAELQAF